MGSFACSATTQLAGDTPQGFALTSRPAGPLLMPARGGPRLRFWILSASSRRSLASSRAVTARFARPTRWRLAS